jgi:CDP-glucose 4,6-dehydratase
VTPDLRRWYDGRRVFVTGHTGFKGSWLTAWLHSAGASVTGFALPPPSEPNLFEAAAVGEGIDSIVGDVRDRDALRKALERAEPEVVLHLAAQSLVRASYRSPVETYATNVVGTAQLLDLVRITPSVRSVVVVTSDKCYENRELDHAYGEDEPMGGKDPYSSSKGCAELVTSAMRSSYFLEGDVHIATARAGNVIGGGDWAEDRLVPDVMRAAAAGDATPIRNPQAVRPWQLVLEPLRGYLMLGRGLADGSIDRDGGAWNFGPREEDCVAVAEVATQMQAAWDRVVFRHEPDPKGPAEARLLKLDCSKARQQLGWEPVTRLADAVDMTVSWYRRYYADPSEAPALVAEQLTWYERRCAEAGAP